MVRPQWRTPSNVDGQSMNCQNTSVTFTIPPEILAGYQSINVDVTHESGLWSPPKSIKF
jgi:hypothetical protein